MSALEKTSGNALPQYLRALCMAVAITGFIAAAAQSQDSSQPGKAATSLKLENMYVLGGKTLKAAIRWKPDAQVAWQFGYEDNTVKEGAVKLDAGGYASVQLVAPDVRHRVVCKFVVLSSGPEVSQDIVVYPSSTLTLAAKVLKNLDIGVIDDTGKCQNAISGEKISFTDLKTTLARDSFEGGMVILSGFESADELIAECDKLSSRVNDGMLAVVINPPADWKAFGVTLVKLEKPVIGQVHIDKDFSETSLAGDMGNGPWSWAIKGKQDGKTLVWSERVKPVETPVRQDVEIPETVKHSLVLARPVGSGWVVVAFLPQMENPADNAVGRVILDKTILWTAERRLSLKTSGEK